MKQRFHGYYRPDDAWFAELWEDCLFAFDANTLLTLYALSVDTREQVLKTLDAMKDRVWLPYQAAKEFHQVRVSKIAEQAEPYKKLLERLESTREELRTEFGSKQHPHISKEIQEQSDKAFERVRKELEAAKAGHEGLYTDDSVLDAVSELFDGRVGDGFSEEELGELYNTAKRRFEDKMPPGYLDKDSKDKPEPRCYNDFVIWREVIEKASADQKGL